MQSSELSNSPKSNRRISAWVWCARVLLGGVLIFSGLSKAIDPWGGLYKMSDYFSAWGFQPAHESMLILASVLASFEFLLGVFTLTGSFRRAVRWLAPAFMAFMTLLSLYIWIWNPVADCGCFGDALVISNSATFFKNIFLLALSYVIWRYNAAVGSLYKPGIQWLPFVVSIAYILCIQVIGYHIQPLIDFRPYPVGSNLRALLGRNEDLALEQINFEYQKDGQTRLFDANNLPDSTWTFVRRIEPDISQRVDIHEIAFMDGEDDVTADLLSDQGDQYILIVSEPQRYGISRSEMANRLYEKVTDDGGDMFAVVALPSDLIDVWAAETGAEYDVYRAEDTDLKMLARGEAALVFIRDGVIKWKRNVYSVPPEFPDGDVTTEDLSLAEHDGMFTKLSVTWLILLMFIFVAARYFSKLANARLISHNSSENPNVGRFTKNM